jgi:carbamate kinase
MRIVVAIGGNAITREGQSGTWDEQLANARVVARELVQLKRHGHEIVLSHGNGPQVGALHLQHDVGADQAPPLPLDALVAMTQGQLGYLLQTAIEELDPSVPTVTVLTRVRVDPADPSFAEPTKPIGTFYSEEEARRLERERGFVVAPDAGRGWRCVVASPQPREIVEFESIRALVERGALVIAAGGGGIPIGGDAARPTGVEAVIDKDRASAALALATGADMLAMLTGVEHVAIDYGTRWQRDMARLTVTDATRLLAEGEFPPGSMGPKVESAARFVSQGGSAAVITCADRLLAAVAGSGGTRVVPDEDGPSEGAATAGAAVPA